VKKVNDVNISGPDILFKSPQIYRASLQTAFQDRQVHSFMSAISHGKLESKGSTVVFTQPHTFAIQFCMSATTISMPHLLVSTGGC